MTREWKAVVGYEGLYEVSSDGLVRSLTRNAIRKTHVDKVTGYARVVLFKDGKMKNHLVHRLMAFAFLGHPVHEEMEVAHNDGVRVHNTIENLRWDTRSGNQSDRKAHGTENWARGEEIGNSKLTEEIVRAIRADDRVQSAVAVAYGVSQSTVSHIKTGATWAHLGSA